MGALFGCFTGRERSGAGGGGACAALLAAVVLIISVLVPVASVRAAEEDETQKVFAGNATPTRQLPNAVATRLATPQSGSPGRLAMNIDDKNAELLLFANPATFPGISRRESEDFGRRGLSLGGAYYYDDFFIDAVGSCGGKNCEQVRGGDRSVPGTDLDVSTAVSGMFGADSVGDDYAFSLGAGYLFNWDSFSFAPYLRADYLKTEIDGRAENLENANPGLALRLKRQDGESFTTSLGGQATYVFSTNLGVLAPFMRLEWEHEYENDSGTPNGPFANSLTGIPDVGEDNVFLIATDDPDRNYFNFGLGLTMVFPNGIMAFMDYETILGLRDIDSHQFAAGLKFEY